MKGINKILIVISMIIVLTGLGYSASQFYGWTLFENINITGQANFESYVNIQDKIIVSDMTSVDSKGLVLYHSLDSNYIDLSSNISLDSNLYSTNDGTMNGFDRNDGVVSGGVTIEDGAMVFDGVDGYVNLGTLNNYNESTEISISLWYKPNNILETKQIFQNYGVVDSRQLLIFQYNNVIRFYTNNGVYLVNPTVLEEDEWVHLVFIYNGTHSYIYTNNYLTANPTIKSLGQSYANYYIGADSDLEVFLNSSLNIALFNKVLTETQIEELYNAGRNSYSPISDGLVAQYSGKDFAGTESSPTVIYDTNMLVAGNSDDVSALSFDGETTYISLPDTNYIYNKSYWTISAWIKSAGAQDSPLTNKVIVAKNNGAYGGIYYSTSGILRLSQYDGTSYLVGVSYDESDTNWHHVIGLYDGNTIKLYLDGVLEATGSDGIGINTDSNTLNIGGQTGTTRVWNGSIGNVLIYDRVLSQDEITAIYNRDKLYFTDSNPGGYIGDFGVRGDSYIMNGSIIMESPNGSLWNCRVNNTGSLVCN